MEKKDKFIKESKLITTRVFSECGSIDAALSDIYDKLVDVSDSFSVLNNGALIQLTEDQEKLVRMFYHRIYGTDEYFCLPFWFKHESGTRYQLVQNDYSVDDIRTFLYY